jgi:hypothetical protein
MWCSTCQQETPGTIHSATARIVCSRCQQPMQSRKPTATAQICDEGLALDDPTIAATTSSAKTAQFRKDDWAVRQRVRTVARELRRPNPVTAVSPNRIASEFGRFDPPQDLFGQGAPVGLTPIAPPGSPSAALQNKASGSNQLAAWLIVILGVLGLASGLGLIGWSLSTGQMQHWNLALGLAMGGQGTLIFGLVLVISRLWRSSRQAAAKLHEVHTRLAQLQHTSETLAATRSGGAPAFYADLVRGASPHVLLANIKGQVDQLATRVSTGW